MKRWAELQATGHYADLPKIDPNQLRLLWHGEFWDVPLSGLVLYQGTKYWFQTIKDTIYDDSAELVYALIELTDDQLREEEYWHELFRQKIGTHTDYDEHGQRQIGTLKPRSMWSEFYDRYAHRAPRDFANNVVLGWWLG